MMVHVVWLTLVLCVFSVRAQTATPSERAESGVVETHITYCNIEVPKKWRLANLSFEALYTFELYQDGTVREVRKIRSPFIQDVEVERCLVDWRMYGFPADSVFSVRFYWNHEDGWIRQEISGGGFSQMMTPRNFGRNPQQLANKTWGRVQ
jgi:hypothetical protein